MIGLRACCASVAFAILSGMPVIAGSGEDAGWSLSLDPRHRAFLSWRSHPGEARDLLLGCLRDVDSFTARSETLGSLEDASNARLVLTNGPNRFEAAGAVTRDQDSGESVFESDIDIDGAKGRALARQLMPVLEGRSDIELAVIVATGPAAVVSRNIPLEGLAPLLDRFRTVCFK